MNDKFSMISAADWKRSIRESRARPNGVAAQIRAALAKIVKEGVPEIDLRAFRAHYIGSLLGRSPKYVLKHVLKPEKK